ncbi:hypothetical protein TRIUR3_21681 [Triticum urartu]|uniref:Uncharacterized protein n=1 Tax=Triticum urartu TaxID=4572 RepID=M8ALM7_TRIUA|nr:hypothetical protein TRIUR3_21681 [Triticum urartu]
MDSLIITYVPQFQFICEDCPTLKQRVTAWMECRTKFSYFGVLFGTEDGFKTESCGFDAICKVITITKRCHSEHLNI